MKKNLLIVCLFFAAFVFSQDNCDHFSYKTKDSIAQDVPGFVYENKLLYSKVYTTIPFLEDFRPGIYIYSEYRKIAVRVFAYVPENSDEVFVYMEPSILRYPGYNTFYPCIDRHVKANIDYFIKTCVKKKKMPSKDTYARLQSILDDQYVSLEHYCLKSNHSSKIYEKRNDGSVRMAEIDDLSVLDSDIDREPLFQRFRSIDSLIVSIEGKDVEKCNWYNLVPNPKKFSAKKYHNQSYDIILKEKDCPAL